MSTVKVNLGFMACFPLSRTGAAHNGLRRSTYIAPLLALDLAELVWLGQFGTVTCTSGKRGPSLAPLGMRDTGPAKGLLREGASFKLSLSRSWARHSAADMQIVYYLLNRVESV